MDGQRGMADEDNGRCHDTGLMMMTACRCTEYNLARFYPINDGSAEMVKSKAQKFRHKILKSVTCKLVMNRVM